MLVWNANFQIPNSGVQAAFVYLFAEKEEDKLKLSFYSNNENTQVMWEEKIDFIGNDENIYDYILSLEKYQQYKKA